MKRSHVLLAAVLAVAVLATSAILSACSGGGGGGAVATPKIKLSGIVSSGSYSYHKGAYGKSYSIPFLPSVDTVVAIPMDRGSLDAWNMTSRVTDTIGTDGKFDLALPMDKDWLLVLINSAGTQTTRFVGSLAVSAGTNTILSLPATVSTLSSLNLGTINRLGGDAVSSQTVTASNFGMTDAQFTAFANSDDVFKNARNIINNYNTTTGIWYQLRPDFTWDGDYSTITSAFTGTAWSYQSFNFQMDTNATNLNIENLCTNGTSTILVGWTPPSDIATVGGFVTYGTGTPITNSAATCTSYLSDGVMQTEASGGGFYATDAYWNPTDTTYGTISYSLSIWFDGTIPPGNWTWWEGTPGNVMATFDPSVSTPVNTSGGSLGYVPSFKLTTSGSGTITDVYVEWYFYDETQDKYTKLTTAADFSVMSHFIERAEIIFETGNGATTRRHSSFDFDPTTQSHIVLPSSGPDSNWTYADMDSGTAFLDSDAGSVGVFYSSGGIGRYFFARATMTL